MLEKMSTNQRVLLATIISLVVFFAYDFFFMPQKPKQPLESNTSTKTEAPAKTASAAPVSGQNMKAPVSKEESSEQTQQLVKIRFAKFDLLIDNLGRVSQVILEEKKYKNESGSQIKLFDQNKLPKPLELRFSDSSLNEKAFKIPYRYNGPKEISLSEPTTITLKQDLGITEITKKITVYPDGHYEATITLTKNSPYYISPGYRPNVRIDGYTLHGALIKEADGTITIIEDGDAKGTEVFKKAKIAAAFDRYYATLFYDLKNGLDVVVSKDSEENPILFVQGSPNFHVGGYFGPKEYETLKAINPELTDVIEYGFFTFIAKPMFKALLALYHFIGNWGWAIVVLTIIIRIILFPLTLKGMLSMQKLKDLAPKIKELQQKYKGDPQKLNAHMMQLYKKHGANPMGGCLPMLLQIPVFFAIYRVLLNAIELKGAPWILWITDLSSKDPYFILPVLMGATMYIHQKITPTTITDPMQKKIFEWLPIVFTFFFLTFPAGLTLYWFVNNILSIIQQLIVNKIFEARKVAQKEKA
ncbi:MULTISPECIES: membrane protein insertase YidC [unclassified Nitratiruptor]|uniref:membrane protein insertase YidC n=1 Tax=unclassified Nitratiruptor TaxID=2624044 RepID=UPI0019162230|nr:MULTISPECIES: membrane protein insertase YidC [unclassified Nitratiruptor]BCD60403.1 YidC/Oxa1 family membrane protein insertase [Nitratiruptor sp. YY08-10]BCD64108.1 YidC/Oxa1 family membrane protein insertase [Nitratiruptor sp. YY08-14]